MLLKPVSGNFLELPDQGILWGVTHGVMIILLKVVWKTLVWEEKKQAEI